MKKAEPIEDFEERGYIRGNFMVPGNKRAIRRKLCTYDEATHAGEGTNRRKRTKKQYTDFTKKLWREMNQRIQNEAKELDPEEYTFKKISKKWVTHKNIMVKKNTVDKYKHSLKHWSSANKKDIQLNNINQTHFDKLIKYLTERDTSLAYQESVIREIKIFLNWAETQGFMNKVPKVEFKKPTKKKPRIYTDEQLTNIEAAIREKIKTTPYRNNEYNNHLRIHMMLKLTGMRIGEVWSMELDRIKIDHLPPYLHIIDVKELSFTVKGRVEHSVNISAKLLHFLKDDISKRNKEERWYLDNGKGQLAYHNAKAASLALFRWNKRLGISGIKRAHGYRATVVTKLGNTGVQTERTQKLVGHKDRKTTDGYFNTDLLDTQELVDKL